MSNLPAKINKTIIENGDNGRHRIIDIEIEENCKQATLEGCEEIDDPLKVSPEDRKKILEEELNEVKDKKLILENMLKEIKKRQKTLEDEIFECMNEMSVPLLVEMQEWKKS